VKEVASLYTHQIIQGSSMPVTLFIIIISDDWLTWAGLCEFETIWLHNAFDAWQFFKPKAG